MATVTVTSLRPSASISGPALAGLMIALAIAAALLAGGAPIAFSIATVFLFAGPHNWFEARYILGRLPARAGKLWPFFAFSFAGIIVLTILFASIPWWGALLGTDGYLTSVAIWNSLLIPWVATLIEMRSRQNPRHDWGIVWPIAFVVLAGNWMMPMYVNLALVYLHPLMALWILDRELLRSRSKWRSAYHACLLVVPILAGAIVWRLWDAPSIVGDDELSTTIVHHAGASMLGGVSTHLLVALHTFLEMVHYSVWLIAIPLIGMRSLPWDLSTIPAARRSMSWHRGIAIFLVFGIFVSVILWVCFVLDYPTTRSIYFTVALAHVLAEVPFLLRAL